jgi:quercetin dioxygenase-like cupin family protein
MNTRNVLLLLSGLALLYFPSPLLFAIEELPHAYPRIGVRTLFENERVFAWDVTWLPGIEQPYHRHRYDLAAVYLRFGPIRITALDGTENPQNPPFEIPRPYYQPAGITHKEEMIGFHSESEQRWAIMFDLKEALGRRVEVSPGTDAAFPRANAELSIENERVLEWLHGWEIGKATDFRTYQRDALQVITEPGVLQYTLESGVVLTEAYAAGDTRFIPAGTVRSEKAVSGSPKAVTIELK